MTQRVRYWSLEVKGTENVTVPAGTCEAYKVALEPLDGEGGGETCWVLKQAPRVVVRSEAQLPSAMGGGTATIELLSRKP